MAPHINKRTVKREDKRGNIEVNIFSMQKSNRQFMPKFKYLHSLPQYYSFNSILFLLICYELWNQQ